MDCGRTFIYYHHFLMCIWIKDLYTLDSLSSFINVVIFYCCCFRYYEYYFFIDISFYYHIMCTFAFEWWGWSERYGLVGKYKSMMQWECSKTVYRYDEHFNETHSVFYQWQRNSLNYKWFLFKASLNKFSITTEVYLDRKKVREKERKREGRIVAENEEKKKYWRRIEIATAAVAIAAK